jgi:hypothetical protein
MERFREDGGIKELGAIFLCELPSTCGSGQVCDKPLKLRKVNVQGALNGPSQTPHFVARSCNVFPAWRLHAHAA